jgi:hypothetical protein
VHEALETVEAPPAESLAGRVLALHEVLENQRRADAVTADQRLQDADDLLVTLQRTATAESNKLRAAENAALKYRSGPFTGPSITTG